MRRQDPAELFELEADVPELGSPVLVSVLDGFIDAGAAGRLARDTLLASGERTRVATFDVDQLLDYRSRRPAMIFVRDHWESYDDPELVLDLLRDAEGTPYLVLSGPEPDTQWERFVAAVELLVRQLDVRLIVGLNGIPMGVPHTRPVGITAHGSRKELLGGHEPWLDTVQVPASAAHLMEMRLGAKGIDNAFFGAHVPHYVAQSEYPAAAAVLLREVAGLTKLALPVDQLEEAAATTRVLLDEQVGQSAEVAEVVRALEGQYDSWVAGRGSTLLAESADLPSADELGAEFERFLAEHTGDTGA
jgi:PAC2 family